MVPNASYNSCSASTTTTTLTTRSAGRQRMTRMAPTTLVHLPLLLFALCNSNNNNNRAHAFLTPILTAPSSYDSSSFNYYAPPPLSMRRQPAVNTHGRGGGPLCMSTISSPSTATTMDSTSSVVTVEVVEEDNNNNNQNNKEASWTDDGFVFGLQGSGLARPKGRTASLVVEGDSLETQPYQVAAVLGTFACHAWFLVHSWTQMLQLNQDNLLLTSLQALVLMISSWILADFGSGVLHWSVDNYGNGRTPIMGGIIAAFQGHHSAPWTITQRGFCNNVYKLCIPFGPVPLGLLSLFVGPFATFFLTIFCVLEILSQEFHKWSHQLKSETPEWVQGLQSKGITIARQPHAQHHLAPYEGNYCIISGACNTALDESGFFRRLEHLIYQWNGVESNAWKLDPALKERTLAGDYRLVQNE